MLVSAIILGINRPPLHRRPLHPLLLPKGQRLYVGRRKIQPLNSLPRHRNLLQGGQLKKIRVNQKLTLIQPLNNIGSM